MKRYIGIFGAVLLFISAADAVTRTTDFGSGTCRIDAAINYKPGVTNCLLDVCVPVGVTGFPTVVWFHGGGLTSGRRCFLHVNTNRIAVVGVDYRLMLKGTNRQVIANGPVSPEMILDDCAAASAWVKRNIAAYGGDPARIVIAGHSAGGYVTYMLGLDARWLRPYGLTPYDFAGYFPLSGQVTKHFAVREYFGEGAEQMRPIFDDWAPFNHIARKTPPFCLALGDARIEFRMRVEETEYLYKVWKALGNKVVELHTYADTNHNSCYWPAMDELMRFVDRVAPPNATTD